MFLKKDMKKRVLFAVGVLLVCLAGQILLGPARAQSSRQSESAAPAPSVEQETPETAPAAPFMREGSGREELFKDLIRQLFVMILFIAAAGAIVWWGARFYRRRHMVADGQQVRVTETIPLGPRKSLHVVEAGSRKLLIASTADRVTFLSDVTDALAAKPFRIPDMEEGDAP
jgi:flagellar biogenesis protein FliO